MLQTSCAFVLGLYLTSTLIAAEPTGQLNKEEQKAFDWFATLGFPDVKGKKFVRVATGRWSQQGDDTPENHYMDGFLLEDHGDSFTVFSLSLAEEAFEKTPDDSPAHERVAYEERDLKTAAVTCRERLRRQAKAEERDVWRRFGERLSERAEVFVLAWACSRNGLNNEAHDLFAQAARMPAQMERRAENSHSTLQEAVAADIAHSQMWQMVVDFGEPSTSREELLKRFRLFVQHFPRTEHFERAKESMALLEKMVQEDLEHAQRQKSAKPFDELDLQEQIAELIFQLRDQNGHQWSQPGACDIFFSISGEENSPAHRLLKIGYDAVPQLIEVLGDERFTRSVGYHRDFYFSHFVLRVGDCAEQIISRIAGRGFYHRTTTFGAMLKDDQVKAVKAEIDAWYADFQKKGKNRC